MAKKLVFTSLTLLGIGLLGGGIWLYNLYTHWLQTTGLNGLAGLMLVILGIFAVIMPLHLWMTGEHLTPVGLVREFVVRGSMVGGVLTALFLGFILIGWLINLPASIGYPSLILPWLTLLVPLVMTGVDFYNGAYARTPFNFGMGFILYTFRIYGLLVIQLTFIPLGFILFPAGFFLQFLSIVDLVVQGLGWAEASMPFLCVAINPPWLTCPQTLLSFHLGHLILVAIAINYGETLFNKASDLYGTSLEWLAAKLKGV